MRLLGSTPDWACSPYVKRPESAACVAAAEFDSARPGESTESVAIGAVRANAFEGTEEFAPLHHQLRDPRCEARLHSGTDAPELRI